MTDAAPSSRNTILHGDKDEISRARRTQFGNEHQGLVIDGGTGEILGRGGAYMYEFEEVDKERFVKPFLDGGGG